MKTFLARRFRGALLFVVLSLAAGQAAFADAALARAIADLESLEQSGGWGSVPPGPSLAPGQRDPRVAALRNRLRAGGDYDAEMQADPWYFAPPLARALRIFQRRHGLVPTGVADAATISQLNVPPGARAQQLRMTLERRAARPEAALEVRVNVADASLALREDGETVLAMRAVIGHPTRPTPLVAGRITRLVFHPAWYVPRRIAVEDLVPQQQADPAFFTRHGIRVIARRGGDDVELDPAGIDWEVLGPERFPYRLRQDPGPANSLGRLKIAFENDQEIFLHDTPAESLFGRRLRAYSSGCVRLERPLEFADALLRRAGVAGTAADYVASGQTRGIDVSAANVMVSLVYETAWVDGAGRAQFRRDIYGHDAARMAARRQTGEPGGDAT